MSNGAERIHLLTLQQDVDLHQVSLFLTVELPVQRRITAGTGLQLIEEVEHDLCQGQAVTHLHTILGQVIHAADLAAASLAQLHNRANVLARGNNRTRHHGLANRRDLTLGEFARVGHALSVASLVHHVVNNVRRGRNQVQVELAFQALTHNLQVQQTQEATAETEAQSGRSLRLVNQCGVVKLQLIQCVTQRRVVRTVNREQAREHHRLGILVTAQGLLRRLRGGGDGITHTGLTDVLHTGNEVTHLAHAQALRRDRLRGNHADFKQVMLSAGGHHLNLLTRLQATVHNTHIGDHAAVRVVHRVKNHGTGRGGCVTLRGGNRLHNAVQQSLNTLTGLTRYAQNLVRLATNQVRQLLSVLIGLSRGKVNLVQHRDDGQVVLHRQVQVRQGLSLNTLGGVHKQKRTLTRSQGAGHLIGEVHVAGGVNHVQRVGGTVNIPGHAHSLGLNGDTAFTLNVHAVQVLRLHIARGNHAGGLQHTVCEGGLTVVNVGDNAEVANNRGVGRRRNGRVLRHGCQSHHPFEMLAAGMGIVTYHFPIPAPYVRTDLAFRRILRRIRTIIGRIYALGGAAEGIQVALNILGNHLTGDSAQSRIHLLLNLTHQLNLLVVLRHFFGELRLPLISVGAQAVVLLRLNLNAEDDFQRLDQAHDRARVLLVKAQIPRDAHT